MWALYLPVAEGGQGPDSPGAAVRLWSLLVGSWLASFKESWQLGLNKQLFQLRSPGLDLYPVADAWQILKTTGMLDPKPGI